MKPQALCELQPVYDALPRKIRGLVLKLGMGELHIHNKINSSEAKP